MRQESSGDIGGGGGLDMAKLRAAVADGRVWITLGTVKAVQNDDTEGNVDVQVALLGGALVWATMAVTYGGSGYGDWSNPDVDDLVLVAQAQQHFGDSSAAYIIARLPNPSMKKPSGDVAGKRRIVVKDGDTLDLEANGASAKVHVKLTGGAKMQVDDGSGAASLALKSDVQTLRNELDTFITLYNAHVHPGVTVGAGSTVATTSIGTSPSTPTGTARLEAE